MNLEASDDFSWSHEVGPHGQEFRLSQSLVDEEQFEEDTDDIQVSAFLIDEWILNQEVLD
jgi:hypothetical protein